MPPFRSGEISLAPCAPAHPLAAPALAREGSVDQAVAHAAAAADITRQFIRAKQPCADGYRWYLRRQERASNYQALLDDLVREGRVEDACWMLDQFGPTNDVLEVDHLEADALVFAGSVRCRGHADVEGVLRTGRSLSVLGGLRVGGALRVGEDLRVAGAVRCEGSARLQGDARVGWSLTVAQRLQCTGSLRVGRELDCGAAAQIGGHCRVAQDLRVVGHLGRDIQREFEALYDRIRTNHRTRDAMQPLPLHLHGLVFRLREADGEYFVYAIDPQRNRIVAYTVFNRLVEVNRHTDRHLRAPHTKVVDGYRRMGIASAIYRWWLDSGRSLMTGARQSAGAHGLWMALARDYELAAARIDTHKRVQQLPLPPPPGFFNALDTRLVLVGRDCRLADFMQHAGWGG